MRKIKIKIRPWKVVAITMVVPAFFVLLACQDQLVNEAREVAQSSTVALDVPPDVQKQYDDMKAAHPDKNFLLVEVDSKGQAKVQSMKEKMDALSQDDISSVNVIKHPAKGSDPERGFIIVEYNERLKQIQEASKTEDDVYTVVEETATPAEGLEKYYQDLTSNIRYPKDSRKANAEGKVFVSFVVETDGSISDVKVLKGVNEELNAEAMRVVSTAGRWTPGRHNGVAVRQRMVLPINFSLGE